MGWLYIGMDSEDQASSSAQGIGFNLETADTLAVLLDIVKPGDVQGLDD